VKRAVAVHDTEGPLGEVRGIVIDILIKKVALIETACAYGQG
jgi:hypothetical protein